MTCTNFRAEHCKKYYVNFILLKISYYLGMSRTTITILKQKNPKDLLQINENYDEKDHADIIFKC